MRFGVMIDCSRNAVMKPSEVKKFATILKKFGYNMLQLYTEDTYEVDNEPYFGYMRGRYTKQELSDIVGYCDSIGMEVIPCVQTLAHLSQIFRWEPYECINDCNDILLVGEERTYKLIENMFRSLRKSFHSEYVHIGMDEAHMLGLGRYKDKHGIKNRFETLSWHLKKVIAIAEKYAFKPIMWSDMFFRLANKGNYYPEEPNFNEEIKSLIPHNVELVYWDYYHKEENYYSKMINAHKIENKNLWFAGGAWTWTGFAGGNRMTLNTMIPAVRAMKENGVENIFFAMWGDDGKECSFYSLLPALFKLKKYYEGENDDNKIKEEFEKIVGENYDAMFYLDTPNNILGNDLSSRNVCKYMLYSDPFTGFLDSAVSEGVTSEYAEKSKRLKKYASHSADYAYLFETAAALCDVLKYKYDLGLRTRKAYQQKNKEELLNVSRDYEKTCRAVTRFHKLFENLWYKENKPFGFEVQDIRLGGLIQRLKSCNRRLIEYLSGETESIPELEEKLLDFYGNGDNFDKKIPHYNSWSKNVSVSIV